MKTSLRPVPENEEQSALEPRSRSNTSVPPIPGFAPRAEDRFAHLFRRIPVYWLIVGAGGITTVIYVLFVVAFPITVWWNHPHTADSADAINDMGRITGYSAFAAFAFVAALLVLFACQFAALQGVARIPQYGITSRLNVWLRRSVFLFPVLFGLIMVWMQPVTTTDLYGYVARGYLYAQLHQNPMITKATLLPGGLSVDRPPSPYGPAWMVVTALVSAVAGNNLLANMLLFKLIGFAGVVMAIWLVDYLARKLYPERRLRIIVLFGWSPLLIFDAIGNGHNDIIMMVCVLAAFALMLNRHARTAFVFLALGALTKYVSAVFIPLWLVYELRAQSRARRAPSTELAGVAATAGNGAPVEDITGGNQSRRGEEDAEPGRGERSRELVIEWMRGAASTVREIDPGAAVSLIGSALVIGLALLVAFYAPFWAGINTFTGLGQQLRPLYYNSSIVGFISAPLQILVPASKDAALDKTLRLIFYTLFFVYSYLQTQRLWMLGRQADLRDVITAAAKITFAALLLITFWFQPWYVVWLLPLAALSQEPFVRRQGIILAAGAIMTYAVANFLLVGDSNLVQGVFVQFFEIIIAFGPLLLLRAAPYDQGWTSIFRRYLGLIGQVFTQRPVFWERLMVVLVLVVAILLRLVRLGNLFSPSGSDEAAILRQASSDLRLYVSDPQGLQGPFVAAQGILVHIFGENPFAVLLPSAIVGSLTVLVIYLMTSEIMRLGGLAGNRTVAVLAALLAATSQWHVSLSRSGMEVVILPLLMCTSIYWLLVGMRKSRPPEQSTRAPAGNAARTRRLRARPGMRRHAAGHTTSRPRLDGLHRPLVPAYAYLLYYIGCGVCTGLACDLEPGLWLVPGVVAGLLLVWRLRMPKGLRVSRTGLIYLTVAAVVAGSPVIWYYLSNFTGFPKGSSVLARSSVPASLQPPTLAPPFWVQAAHNLGGAVNLLVSQDYTAGYPSAGGATIIPVLLGPFFFLGLLFIVIRARSLESQVLLLLIALPIVASVAVGTPTSAIEAASVLPAMCIVPALGLYEVVSRLGHLPIVLDRINGTRVFSTPEQIGRVLLLGFLLFSTVRTFFWYFEATLPPHQNQYNASWIGSPVAHEEHEENGSVQFYLDAEFGGRKITPT